MEWQEIKQLHLSNDIQKIVDESGCDCCGCKEDLLFSKATATILCPICNTMILRICENRNKRIEKLDKIQRDYYGGD